MKIPKRHTGQFVREIADDCLTSQNDRINRGAYYKNYALFGAEQPSAPALYNKTYAYLDDLESLLYSPVGLRFHISDPEIPNLLQHAKGRAAAQRLRNQCRRSDTDSMISEAVFWSLVKGKTLIKQGWKGGQFAPNLLQPEHFGVLHENHTKLDQDMEAFCQSSLITPYQLDRLIAKNRNRAEIKRKAQKYQRDNRNGPSPADGASKQVIVGGLYPFQPQGGSNPNNSRGIVDWMGGPEPIFAPRIMQSFLRMEECWIWDDDRDGWATFQLIGDDILIWGEDFIANIMAWDTATCTERESLKGQHPYTEFCPNRIENYFWGRSEITNVALLQEAINSRVNGINRMLRLQEDPPTYFKMSQGVNQVALSRFNKPGGYWSDTSPNADMKKIPPEISKDLWESLHEYERMFDEMGGLPPIAKGHGEAGVRSAGHAETLVRMFSPRFKDRALLTERSVEDLGSLMLDLDKAHDDRRMLAWVPGDVAGLEGAKPNPLLIPPAKGLVAVPFTAADLDPEMSLAVDAHSSSPAFQAEAKSLTFDLLKVGGMDAIDLLERVDIGDPSDLQMGVLRKRIAASEAEAAKAKEEQQLKLAQIGAHRR